MFRKHFLFVALRQLVVRYDSVVVHRGGHFLLFYTSRCGSTAEQLQQEVDRYVVEDGGPMGPLFSPHHFPSPVLLPFSLVGLQRRGVDDLRLVLTQLEVGEV